jgi:SNF2 family DNA or RNA helicase
MIAKSQRTRRLILTGTPIMNNLKELHTLFDFATSGKVLGTHRNFQNEFGKPIEAARSADADDREVEKGGLAMQQLQELIQPYFLQRMKSEYLADILPPKHEYVLWTNLSPLQREIYAEYIQSECVSGYLEGEAKSPLVPITWLQKLCGHPLLVEKESVDEIDNFNDNDPGELMESSTKLDVMYYLVNSLIAKGHRTLIFSQFKKVLDIIEQVLRQKFKLSRIDSGTKERDRQTLVDEFNQPDSDIDIMLITTKAGGQGLTLTGADSCVVYDPSWNPAEDAQAVGKFPFFGDP